MKKTNYHTHTPYCDGHSSMEQMVESAIKAGFSYLGFSPHAMIPFSSDWHIDARRFCDYTKELSLLKKKYEKKIKLLCAVEADFVTGVTRPEKSTYEALGAKLVIGSVHYIHNEHGIFAIDGHAQEVQQGINECFGGDTKKAICEYFACERKMISRSNFDILGHADVCRRRNDEMHLFDENDSWYREELRELADCVAHSGVVAEVNTGGWARANILDTYPSDELLSMFFERGVPVTFSSDAHDADKLDFAYGDALRKIVSAGYKEVAYFDEDAKLCFQKIA